VGQDFVFPGNAASHLATLVLVPVLDIHPIILSSFISFCEFIPESGLFWHPAK
jgi:hypothetical protein